ncbi:MAG: hypothetical protein IJ693_03545 [Bacteroidaceae bacterium]|nr:hypothetical protein [Bacteroidaceae bacterium]
MKRLVFCVWAVFVLVMTMTAQSVSTGGRFPRAIRHSDRLTSYKGLGHVSVFDFYKDKTGLVWIATNRGVCSYNGHVVRRMRGWGETGLVLTLNEAEDGRLLAGCATGLYEIDRKEEAMRRIAPDITDVNAICGSLVGGSCGLWKKEGDGYVPVPIEGNIISRGNYVTDIVRDGEDYVWVSTAKRLIHLSLKDGGMDRYGIPDSLLTHNIRCICLVGRLLYVGTRNNGLLTFDTRSHQTYRGVSVPSNVITDLRSDGKRFLYVATDGKGAYTIDTKTREVVKVSEGKTDAVYTFGHDPLLNIDYLGYYLEGFSHELTTRQMVGIYGNGDIATDTLATRSLCREGQQMVVGTRKGLYLIDEAKGSTRYFSPQELGASIVTNVCHFGGVFVVATYESGLRRLTTDGLLLPLVDNGSFSSLRTDPKGERLYAAGNTGVTIFNQRLEVVQHFDSKNSELADEYLTDVLPDGSGKAWVGSLSRLYLYDPVMQTVQAGGFPQGFFNLAPSLHFTMTADGDILAWSGTHLYKTKTDCSSYEEIPLYERFHIGDIAFIRWHKGHYWIGTSQGLFITDKDFSTGALHLSEADGLPSPRFQNQECLTTTDGSLWMMTDRGIVVITPSQQQHLRDSIPAHVMLNDVEWDGSKLSAFQPLLLNYSTDLGKMYEYTLDGNDTLVCTDGDMVPLGWQHWGRHRLTVWLMGHPETQMQLSYWYLPSALFWAICIIFVLLGVSLWLVYRDRHFHKQQFSR